MEKIKKIAIFVLIAIATLTTMVLAATGIVNAPSGLVLREEASRNGSVITTIEDGTTLEILEKDGDWYKVIYNGDEGYVFAQYIEANEEDVPPPETPETPETPEAPTNTETKQAQLKSDAKIYMMPLISSTSVGTMVAGTNITIEKQITNWSYVTDGTNEGWIRTYAINNQITSQPQPEQPTQEPNTEQPSTEQPNIEQPDEPTINNNEETAMTPTHAVIDVSNANMRKDASQTSEIVTTLSRDTDVTVTAEKGDWYKITYIDVDGVTTYEGYMLKTLLKVD